MMHTNFMLLMLSATLSFAAYAADDELTIQAPYVRLVPPGSKTTGAFMVIANTGTKDLRLVGAESPTAQTVQLHNHISENGVMKMRQVADIDIRAHTRTELKPGSYHIMLIDLGKELVEGDRVPITLKFSDGQQKVVEAPVRKMQTTMPMANDMKSEGMQH